MGTTIEFHCLLDTVLFVVWLVPASSNNVEVKRTKTDRIRAIYESMTKNRAALELLSLGIVCGISTIVQPPCEDPTPF